jgi:hypothetical protein
MYSASALTLFIRYLAFDFERHLMTMIPETRRVH